VNALRQAQIQREWLGYEEARRLVGLSRTTLCRLVRTGEIKGARIGRSVRINRASLEEYMERRVVSGNENSHHAQVRLRHHPGAGPRRTRARAWVFVFDCYAKKAARTRSGEDGMSGPENDRATSKGRWLGSVPPFYP
jgi:excisionase family DNA binding protein